MTDETAKTILRGILKYTDKPVSGFVSLDGYQGAPGYIVQGDGKFFFEIPRDVVKQLNELNAGPDHQLYAFKSGGGTIVVPFELAENSEIEISINFEDKKHEIKTRRHE
ncbi:MAG: hypothetical protein HZC40_24085 [Chloroflexi bacterium]|nr:hypothetical protein [Chloroflexota bacterium]